MSAAGFYTRAGFAARGSPFDEAGIAHLEMVRALERTGGFSWTAGRTPRHAARHAASA
jgi:hypothetical protein